MLGPQARDGERRERGERPVPARSPPKRQETSVPATVVLIHVSQMRRSLNQVTRLSANPKPSKR